MFAEYRRAYAAFLMQNMFPGSLSNRTKLISRLVCCFVAWIMLLLRHMSRMLLLVLAEYGAPAMHYAKRFYRDMCVMKFYHLDFEMLLREM